jgi:hypothetical protein
MLRDSVATENISTFGTSPKADFVPPLDEKLVTVPASLLQDLKDEVAQLKATITRVEAKVADLEATADVQAENEVNLLRFINDLRKDREPQPLQKDRGEILRALLAANGGKMLAKEARQKMRLSEQLFSMLVSSMEEYIEIKTLHSDKRKNLLILK